MTEPIIQLQGVHKRFGRHDVLGTSLAPAVQLAGAATGVELAVPAGKTYAFLGRNGAGKTTTIRLLMGLLKPDAGKVRVLGLDPARDAMEIRRRVGYLAEDQQMWGWMTVGEILRFMAPFFPTWHWDTARELVDKFALPADARIRTLSKGQNVRLGLLLALAHRPELMILDDPALGLDPIMRKEFLRDVVSLLQGRGVTVFFSSHLLYEVEPVADIVGILDRGQIVCQQETETLRQRVRQIVIEDSAWRDLQAKIPGILDVKRDGSHVAMVVEDAAFARTVLGAAVVEETGLNLDEIFEAYVVGRKELRDVPLADVERVP